MAVVVALRDAPHTAVRMAPLDPRDPETDSDEAVMRAWQAGDLSAFDRLYTRHRGGVFRYFLRQCGDRATAEELHHDVWLKVIGARDRWQPDARFATWLYTLARHRLIDFWRASAPQRLEALEDDAHAAPETDDPQAGAATQQQGTRLAAALGSLPEAQRDAFLLHVEGGLAIAEIAQLTSVPPETVKSRLRYAYARLRTSLGDLQ